MYKPQNRFKNLNPELRFGVLNHLKAISKYYVLLIFVYNLNIFLFNLLTHVPFVSKLVLNVNNLIYAYETEIAFNNSVHRKKVKLNRDLDLVSSINPLEILDYIVVGSGPGAAAAVAGVESGTANCPSGTALLPSRRPPRALFL